MYDANIACSWDTPCHIARTARCYSAKLIFLAIFSLVNILNIVEIWIPVFLGGDLRSTKYIHDAG